MKPYFGVLFIFFTINFNGTIQSNIKHQRLEKNNLTNNVRRQKNHLEELSKHIRKSINSTSNTEKEALFGDVIKNITRVNNVLEELIKNYEKLKHIYKSKETFVPPAAPDIDTTDLELEDNIQIKERAKTNDPVVTKDPNKPATEMFIFDEKEEAELEAVNKEFDKKKDIKKVDIKKKEKKHTTGENLLRAPTVQYLKQSPKEISKATTVAKTTYRDPISEENENNRSSETSSSLDDKLKEPETKLPKAKTKPLAIEFKSAKDEKDVIVKKPLAPKSVNDSRLVKTVIKAEEYSPNFWDKLAQNSPVNLRTEQEITYGSNFNSPGVSSKKGNKNSIPKAKFKSIHVNTGLQVGKGHVKQKPPKHSNKYSNTTLRSTDSLEWSVEDDKTIEKEQFKTSILRKAYGDACLKVVVKKCYKACKEVPKTACVKYDCSANFKNQFKEFAKTGCIKEFRDETFIRQQDRQNADIDDYDFVDITRNGYLAAACLPTRSRPKTQTAVLRTGNATTKSSKHQQLNILRDRFEMACQKASAEKCKRACYYTTCRVCSASDCKKILNPHFTSVHYGLQRNNQTVKKTRTNILWDRFEMACQKASAEKCKRACYYTTCRVCPASDCKVGKKSALARECRAHCKRAYHYTGEKGSDSDSDSDGDDEISSSESEDEVNDSKPDPDFEAFMNNITLAKRPKKVGKSGAPIKKVSKGFNTKKNLRKTYVRV